MQTEYCSGLNLQEIVGRAVRHLERVAAPAPVVGLADVAAS